MPDNTAAWTRARGARLEVGPAPYTAPGPDQLVVRNHAVAVNPLDWLIQVAGSVIYRWLDYPAVLGSDVAGDVVEVGSAVTRFQVGDRVLAHAVGTDKDANTSSEGGFQGCTVVLERMTSPIPDSLPYADACVLPLGISTAACALFQSDQLALQQPSASPQATGQTVLVWGGSTSVGSNAVQLAVAAGYEVVTTASPHNADYVTQLGASQVLDYASPTIVPELIAAFAGRTLAGAVAIGTGSAEACVDVVRGCTGRRFVAIASTPVSFAGLTHPNRSRLDLPRLMGQLIRATALLQAKARLHRVTTKFIVGTTLKTNDVSKAVYQDFLPAALADGRYQAAPPPYVVGHDLDDVQPALDLQRKGVSAQKVVIQVRPEDAGQ